MLISKTFMPQNKIDLNSTLKKFLAINKFDSQKVLPSKNFATKTFDDKKKLLQKKFES